MNYEKWIGCNGEIDLDTVKDMNIDDNCIKCFYTSFKILFNITTDRRAIFKEEYKPAKERVQEQMETHQIILRNILGDPNFSW